MIALLVFAIFEYLSLSGSLEYFELKSYDLWVNLQPRDPRMSDKIVVVTILEDELRKDDLENPLRDAPLLKLLNTLQQDKPAAIALDLFRDRELYPALHRDQLASLDQARSIFKQAPTTQRDGKLAGVFQSLLDTFPTLPSTDLARFIRQNPNVYFVRKLAPRNRDDLMVGPPPIFNTYARPDRLQYLRQRIGVATVTPDRDGIVRRGVLQQNDEAAGDSVPPGPDTYLSLSALMANTFVQSQSGAHPESMRMKLSVDSVQLGSTTFPCFKPSDGGYVNQPLSGFEFLLDYRGGNAGHLFRQFSMKEILDGAVNPADIRGKLVFLGTAAVSTNDNLPTPISRQHLGVQIQAQMCDQLLRGFYYGTKPIAALGRLGNALWLAFWCGLAGIFGALVRGPGRFATGLIAGLIITTVGAYSMYLHGIWILTAAPAMGWFTTAAVTTSYMAYREQADRELLKKVFGPYVDANVLKKMLEEPDQLLLDGHLNQEKRVATVLFTDMVGYSTVSESEEFKDPRADDLAR